MNNHKLVSVIITTYRRPNLLIRAINSVLNQTYKNIEIIIVDDASTDNTEEIVRKYQLKNDNIIYIKNDQSMGANVGRNKGIKIARGTFIAGLDDDDEFTSNRIELLVTNYDPEYSLITTKNIIKLSQKRTRYQKGKKIIYLDDILYENSIGNQVLVEKQRVYDVGFYDEELTACQDYDLWIRLIIMYGPAKSLDEYTQIIYANHSQNRISTPTSRKKFKGYFNFYKKFKYLMNRDQKKSQLAIIIINFNKKLSFKKLLTLNSNKQFIKLLISYVRGL